MRFFALILILHFSSIGFSAPSQSRREFLRSTATAAAANAVSSGGSARAEVLGPLTAGGELDKIVLNMGWREFASNVEFLRRWIPPEKVPMPMEHFFLSSLYYMFAMAKSARQVDSLSFLGRIIFLRALEKYQQGVPQEQRDSRATYVAFQKQFKKDYEQEPKNVRQLLFELFPEWRESFSFEEIVNRTLGVAKRSYFRSEYFRRFRPESLEDKIVWDSLEEHVLADLRQKATFTFGELRVHEMKQQLLTRPGNVGPLISESNAVIRYNRPSLQRAKSGVSFRQFFAELMNVITSEKGKLWSSDGKTIDVQALENEVEPKPSEINPAEISRRQIVAPLSSINLEPDPKPAVECTIKLSVLETKEPK